MQGGKRMAERTSEEKTLEMIIEKFWGEVKNSPDGEMAYDFSKKEHLQVYYNTLDVDEFIADAGEKEDTGLLAQSMIQSVAQGVKGTGVLGFQDSFQITPIRTRDVKQASVRTAANKKIGNTQAANYVQKKDIMMINVELRDKNYPEEVFYANSGICRNDRQIDLDAYLLSTTPTGRYLNEYETRCTFSSWEKDLSGSGKLVLSAVAKYCEDSYAPAQKIIEEINVSAPMKWQSKKGNETIVCYNRRTEAGDPNPDYVYPTVIVDKSKEPKKITIHLPFKGEIKMHVDYDKDGRITEGVAIHHVDLQSFKMSVTPRDFAVGGETVFNKAGQKEKLNALFYFDDQDKITVTGPSGKAVTCYTKVKWELDKGGNNDRFEYHNWGQELEASHVMNDTHVMFNAVIPLKVMDISTGIELQPVRVSVRSYEGEQPKESNICNIPYIWLWWGCVGGDSLVDMEDGSRKKISEIRVYDMVRAADGKAIQVENVYYAREDQVIRLETEGGKKLLCSTDHPVLTNRGMIRADELTAGDQIQTVDGLEPIRTLKRIEYHDMVYNLQFSEKNTLYFNGIASGDMLEQQETRSAKASIEDNTEEDTWGSDSTVDKLTKELLGMVRGKASGIGGRSRCNVPARSYYGCPFNAEEQQNARLLGMRKELFAEGFTADVWVNIQGQSGSILSQEGGFVLGVSGECIEFSHPDLKKWRIPVQGRIYRAWNNLFVSWKYKTLVLGINGIIVCREPIADIPLIHDGDFQIGADLDGFIRRIVIYDREMPLSFLRSHLFCNVYQNSWRRKKHFKNIVAFLDWNGTSLADIGPNKFLVRGQNFCVPTSLVSCYLPSAGSYASVEEGSHINPGGFESGQFAIYIKFYYKDQLGRNAVLLSNGCLDSRDGVSLYIEETDEDGGKIHLLLGTEDCIIAEGLETEQWIDLIVSYRKEEKKAETFINGKVVSCIETRAFARASDGEVRIGNGRRKEDDGEDRTCTCYFSIVAIFDHVLDESMAGELYENPPFLCEKNLAALYYFGSDCPAELVSGKLLTLRQEDISVQQDVIESERSRPYTYRIAKEPAPVSKQTIKLYRYLADYFGKRFGLDISSIGGMAHKAALNWIERELLKLPACRERHSGQQDQTDARQVLRMLDAPKLIAFAEFVCMNDFENELKGRQEDMTGMADVVAGISAIEMAIQYDAEKNADVMEMDETV